MADTDYEHYDRGSVAVDGGELQEAFDINFEIKNGSKGVHTFANDGMVRGSVGGHKSANATFKVKIARAGLERDYLQDEHKRRVKRVKFKLPGKTVILTGPYDKVTGTTNSESPWELAISMNEAAYSC